MNKIITTYAADGLPYVSGLIDLLSEGYQQITAGLARAFIGAGYDPAKAYILNGLVASSSGLSTNFTEGLVLYGNELFYSPAQSVGIFVFPNVLIANIQEDFPGSAEPLLYDNGATHNTGARRRLDMAAGTSGSGTIADYADMIRVLQPMKGYDSGGAALTVDFPTGGANSVTFTENRVKVYDALGTNPGIGLDDTNAIDGCVVELLVLVVAPTEIVTFYPGTVSPVYLSPLNTVSNQLVMTYTGNLLIRIRYQKMGTNTYAFITTERSYL